MNASRTHIARMRFQVACSYKIRIPIFSVDEFSEAIIIRFFSQVFIKSQLDTYRLCFVLPLHVLESTGGTQSVWVYGT